MQFAVQVAVQHIHVQVAVQVAVQNFDFVIEFDESPKQKHVIALRSPGLVSAKPERT